MPKVVDNYVFERKIGSGQYGDVYKGYNKVTGQDIAIKAIKRQNIKGKFMELLENQIKVLKTCDNRNIIKLYDIKKTANNFYLILQYCNQGDLSVYLKRKKTINQQEAIEFFIQILNAFKTLVKNKIMHRDFKLANILMHDGEIKIADFGFSKLLTNQEFTETMLGSPLNMAPEVLGGTQYNSKADLWSIGVVFYEMLFGTPPYKASNMVDLINNIKNKPLSFPKSVNQISPVTQDAIRKMLTVDPKKRIEWQTLFNHPIVTYLQDKIKKDMDQALNNKQDDLTMNVSKFYLKANMVVDHPKEIQKKQNLNNYAYDVVNKKTKQQFNGNIIKRSNERKRSVDMGHKELQAQTSHQIKDNKQIQDEETERQKQIRAFKRNSAYILHRRNIYVFLAAVAEEAMERGKEIKVADAIGYLLVRKLLNMLEWLKTSMDDKKQFPGLQCWQQFVKQKDYKDIRTYVQKEYDIFKVFYESVHNRVKDKVKQLDPEAQEVLQNRKSPNSEKIFQRLIREYISNLSSIMQNKQFKSETDERKFYIHLTKIIDCLDIENVFQFDKNGTTFNFHNYYQEPNRMQVDMLRKQVIKKVSIV